MAPKDTKGEALSTESYKGVRDFYPADWAQLQSVFDTVRAKLRSYGYEEYNASPLEPAELYESKTSEEIVNEQTFTFTDRGDRRVTLRPEMTPTLARMIAGKKRELVFPVRWFNIGNRFRYERPQKGRMREFYQIDVDLIGIADAKADGEIIVLASECLKALGAYEGDFTIRINSRALLNAATDALGYTADESKEYLRLLDRAAKLPAEELEAARAPFRREGKDALELILSGEHLGVQEEKAKLEGLIEEFEARGMNNVVFDPSIIRGFDYYTGTIFEIYDTNPENKRALFGGGRYDNLLALFGGESIPAIGFAIGDVSLLDFLDTHGYAPKASSSPLLFLGTPSDDDIAAAQEFATTLREAGLSVLVNVSGKALGDQIREAARREIPYFIAYGRNELDSGMVKLKSLNETSEREMSAAEVVAELKRLRT
ncbi:MAG: hisS [Parcubacteria group bacterium]|nr:hisS [Parcubacteria group bacterium]